MSLYRTFVSAVLSSLVVASVSLAQVPVNNFGPAPVNPAGMNESLINSVWAGHETLQNYGNLAFRFQDGGVVVMIDTQGQNPGAYMQTGDSVNMTFFNGAVTYQGRIQGQSMNGIAQNKAGARWTFQVNRQGSPVTNAAVGPVHQVNSMTPVNTNLTPSTGPAPVNLNSTTGPVNIPSTTGPTGTPNTTTGPSSSAQAKVTPETLPEYLRKLGFQPKQIRPEVGAPYCVVEIKENDGWNFVVEVYAQNGIWLVAPLQALSNQMPPARILQLLEANNNLAPCFFTYRAADGRACLRLEVIGGNPTEQSFRGDLRILQNAIRRSHSLWNVASNN